MIDPGRLERFVAELRRRRVVRVVVVYALVAWALIEIADTAFPHLGLPGWSVTLVIALALMGFPLAAVLAWAFQVTPEGMERTRPLRPREESEVISSGSSGHPVLRFLGYGVAGAEGMVVGAFLLSGTVAEPPPGDRTWSSIAVVPFADLSPDSGQAYLGDGIAEELTHALTGVDGLKVAPRTSASIYRERAAGVPEIGRDLGVEAVLEGSVRRSDGTMRVTVQLVDADEGFQIWSRSYDRTFDDVFQVQEEIARSVVEALGLELPAHGRSTLVDQPTDHPEAYDLYLRGRRAWARISADGYREAIPWFERAIELDSTYAAAYSGLADAYIFLGHWHGAYPEEEWVARADSLLDRALELDPTLGEAYASRSAMLNYRTGGEAWREAEDLVETAAALSPRYTVAHAWIAWVRLEGYGDLAGALAAGARAHELDPVSWPVVRNYGRALLFDGRTAEAIRVLEEVEPVLRDESPLRLLAHAYSAAERHEDAEVAARRWTSRIPAAWWAWLTLAEVRAAAGDRAGGRQALERALDLGARGDRVRAVDEHVSGRLERALDLGRQGFRVGLVHGLLGDMDEAFRWLERGGWTLWDRAELEFDPVYDPIRDDPRWSPLLERIKEELDVEG